MAAVNSHRRRFFCGAGLGAAALLTGCSPLRVLNGWIPSTTYRAHNNIAYGNHPRQKLDIYLPAVNIQLAPVVVFFYGGSWNSGDRSDYLFTGEALAAKGCIAVLPDYRLYPEVRFPDFLNDSASAVRWVLDNISRYGGDLQRLYLMGHSAGAYNAAMLALNPVYLGSAGVARHRVSGLIGLAGPYDFLPLTGSLTKQVFGFPNTAMTTQPIHFASADAPSSLLITGAKDDIVDPGNSRRLAQRLRERGAQAREIVYPELGHRTLLATLAAPLRNFSKVMDDITTFINASAPDTSNKKT